MSGTGWTIIPQGATLTINNPSAFISIISRTLDNAGTTTWSGATMTFGSGVITNEFGALFQVLSPTSINYGGGSPRFDNAGTFDSAPTGTTSFGGVPFNNYNTVNVQGGTFYLNGGGLNNGAINVPATATLLFGSGSFTSSASSTITGAGSLNVNAGSETLAGTVHLAGSNAFTGGFVDFTGNYICTNNLMFISAGNASFDGTSLVSPSTLTLSGSGAFGGAQNVIVTGAMTWTGGSMNGTGWTIIPQGATLTINNPSAVISIISRTLDNRWGTTDGSGAGQFVHKRRNHYE